MMALVSQELTKLEQTFQEQKDAVTTEKVDQLHKKWNEGEFVLAFCGHFSAGKSTMINTLIGKEILPSSPIPTSANVVKVKTGEAKAIAYFKGREPAVFDYVQDLNQVQRLCRDGEEVVSVDIFYPNEFLVNGASLLDTPGIDSTDSAHKIATESAIYLADAVVYMMDYNHVQSELNFRFTKILKEKGKTLFLVINQIDKHFDLELDFSDFKQGVKDAFLQWGVEPDAIFYTTLRTPDHPENQLEELHDHLYSLFWEKEKVLQESVIRSVLDLIHEHERFIRGKTKQQKESLREYIGEKDEAEIEAEYTLIQEQLEQLQNRTHQFRDRVIKELQSVIDNANITPFSMRDLATSYLESCEPGFKVGFLFSSKKTQQEKERRFHLFFQEVEKQVIANLEWHVRDLLQKIPKVYSIPIPSDLLHRIDGFQDPLNPELLASLVKQGARVTGDAVLNYCRDVATEIKSRYRRSCLAIIEECVNALEKETEDEKALLLGKRKDFQPRMEAIKEISSIEERETRYIQGLKDEWQQVKQRLAEDGEQGEENQPPEIRRKKEKALSSIIQTENVQSLEINQDQATVFGLNRDFKGELIRTSDSLRKAALLIENLRGQSIAVKQMKGRADRLQQNLFTVAIFGAFSSGKSSFANALMGEMVLPVSPNPTTATINKILPPTDQFPHGSVRVKFKDEYEMTREVIQSLQVFRLQAETIEKAIDQVTAIALEQLLPTAKPYYSFLKAVQLGFEQMKGLFGQELLVGMEEFKGLVAMEEKSCFVEWIELYYDCPITKQGISLVDTPGADSIHARHTGVAFEYMKNADAVLFATYYNHAFSQADREFLLQMGRVKDILELDKMFFLVNAADLARSEEELQGVVDHVKQNLLACGIRQPRLYPLSSQTALLARMYAAGQLTPSTEQLYKERTRSVEHPMSPEKALAFSGFQRFERDFIQFTMVELTELAVEAAKGEIDRAIHAIHELLETTKDGEEQRRLRLTSALESQKVDLAFISTRAIEREQVRLRQEVEELFYYVKQRLFFRFHELFSLSFNPAVIKEGKGREILPFCLDDLMRNIEFTLKQEIQSTTLLIEKTGGKLILDIFQEIRNRLKADLDLFYRELQWNTPVITQQLSYDPNSVRSILNQFKSPKQFFEQGGRDAIRQQLEIWVNPIVSNYLDACQNQMSDNYAMAFENQMLNVKQQWLEQTEEYYDGLVAALEERVDIQQLEEILEHLQGLV